MKLRRNVWGTNRFVQIANFLRIITTQDYFSELKSKMGVEKKTSKNACKAKLEKQLDWIFGKMHLI